MNLLALVEGIGLVSCALGIWFILQARGRLTHDGRLTLLVMFLVVGLVHFLDMLEWSGSQSADRYGDVFKIFTPTVWLFFLFVVRRDGLLQQVEQQDQQLDFFFEHAPMAIAVLDQDDSYLACSQKWLQMHGLTRSPVGKPLRDFPSPWSSLWNAILEDSKRKSAPLSGMERLESTTGEHYIEWKARPFRRESTVFGTILIMDDVTERILQDQQREFAQFRLMQQQNLETVGEIATGVAHDVNNLLQVISAHASALEEERLSDEELRDSFNSIRDAVGSASGMTRWLLSYGKRSKGTVFVRLDLCELLTRVTQLLRRAIPRSQRLVVRLPAVQVHVMGDETLLEQLIINLVLNARDAMLQGGEVSVILETENGRARLSVRDQGTGIDDSIRDRILEPFFTTKGEKGTGMGLAVVRRAISAHGAELELSSDLGVGSCFAVHFPAPDSFQPDGGPTSQEAESGKVLRRFG